MPADRSHASLRTALWRIRQAGDDVVRASRETVRLDDRVEVDVRRGEAQASRLLGAGGSPGPFDTDLGSLRGDLLPGWQEDWLLLERERVRQVQIHALEAIARHLCAVGRYAEATDAAYAAIAGEPLRESAHAALIDVLIAEGNVAQARDRFRRYADLLWAELAIRPSPGLAERIDRACSPRATPAASGHRPPGRPAARAP